MAAVEDDPVRGEATASESTVARATQSLERGIRCFAARQGDDGSWRGDYGGPLFLLPLYVASAAVARKLPGERDRTNMVRYMLSVQNPDGSISLHADSRHGTMFTSSITYVALRLLGEPPERPELAALRQWIHTHGTPLGSASWGKWILALLGLYDYRGVSPVLPELYLLPYWLPMHPARFWCHTRQVYLPTAYLFGAKLQIEPTPELRAIRDELYDRPYETIPFERYQEHVAPTDQLVPMTWLGRLVQKLAAGYEQIRSRALRQRALERLLLDIDYEDRTTGYNRIGPVNAALNTIVHDLRNGPEEVRQRGWTALQRYLQRGPDGVKMNGYLSTSLWDTAFAVQALLACPAALRPNDVLTRAADYVVRTQIREELADADKFYRDPVRGGWPFCDKEHGWPITDCTAEGLKAVLRLQQQAGLPADDSALQEAVEFLLKYQNRDGGWATYERRRGGAWLEWLNPSQLFSDIMVDYSFVECTSACVQALAESRDRMPPHLQARMNTAIRRGQRFLLRRQRADGSWEGAWGICFTYGAWFGVQGLRASGLPQQAEPLQRAARFLIDRQNADGGWSEDCRSCVERRYIPRADSSTVNTAWALLALQETATTPAQQTAVSRGIEYLIRRQQPDGDWPPEPMTGVFNRTCGIHYDNYRRYFPIWALARFLQQHS